MGKYFGWDSPFMNGLYKLTDLFLLNFLTAICCIPVITIGASLTALHYVALKMAEGKEGYVTKSFFKSFKENFKQATLIWLILLFLLILMAADILIFRLSGISFPTWCKITLIILISLIMFASMYLFPLLSRYENNIWITYKNSFIMGIIYFPKTIAMMFCWLIPVAILIYIPILFPLVFFLGISGPAFLNALLYKKSFQQLNPDLET